MYEQELSRNIVISESIDERTAERVITHINEINEVDHHRLSVMPNDYRPEIIKIHINSGGGSASDGFAIIGAMEMSETPIVTIASGMVASMALGIFVAGDVRYAHRHTRFMYHTIAYGMGGKIADHDEFIQEAETLQKMYNSLIFEKTKMTEDELHKFRVMKQDHYFGAMKALKYGVTDRVIDKPEKRLELPKEETEETEGA